MNATATARSFIPDATPADTSAEPTSAEGLPLDTRFQLGAEITPVQKDFLDRHGYLVFDQVATRDEVNTILAELDRIDALWQAEGREYVNGIPIFYGKRDGKPWVQRFTFTSTFSEPLARFVRDARFEPVRKLIGEDARVGDREKDGVVVNRYLNAPGSIYKRLGWHTDGLRDIFYGRMPVQMLNVGLHFDACTRQDGGLRLIPGTHTQGFRDTLLRKIHFVSHDEDPAEICVETKPGDLTVHDGRLWHRVARSSFTGAPSLRRSMYVPYLTGPYEPKDDSSKTPTYHRFSRLMMKVQARLK